MKIVKFLLSDIQFDSRDKREIAVLKELGHKVIVLCIGEINETIETNEGFTIHRIKTLGLTLQQSRLLRLLKIIRFYLYIRKFLKSLNADCISCHDLSALCLGWSSTWFLTRPKRPQLVYDSHEFEAGRNTKRNHLSLLSTIYLERFLTKRTAFNLMVNDTIADEVQKLHKLKVRPVVLRNVAPYWKIDKAVCESMRKELIESMNTDEERISFLVMYHGGVTNGRGIENIIRAVSKISKVAAVILGNGESSYINALRDLAEQEEVIDKILFHPYVPVEVLWQYLGAADVGIVNIENVCRSYYYSLPNKLLENIQAETPVIGSDFPEISRIIKKYNIGLTCNPQDVKDIVSAIEKMKSNKEHYALFKTNLRIAKKELCWENEKKVLINAYSGILNKI